MKILFHVGVGNYDRPKRWTGVNYILSSLANGFDGLGHRCLVWCHPEAKHNNSYKNIIYSKHVDSKLKKISKFSPDWIFTWNGSSEGDKKIINHFGIEKMIFGELGFFDHYKTAYFDFSGTNANSQILYEELDDYNDVIINSLINKYKKDRIYKKGYIFVPLQDENDTQITNYSPIKKMEHLLSLVERKYPDKTILYKKHPQYKLNIKTRSNFIEVNEDVHHYIPYADKVIGINSNVLFETLLYHSNVESYGYGMCSRKLNNDNDRKKFITHCYNRQLLFEDLNNTLCIKDSYFYKKMTNVN